MRATASRVIPDRKRAKRVSKLGRKSQPTPWHGGGSDIGERSCGCSGVSSRTSRKRDALKSSPRGVREHRCVSILPRSLRQCGWIQAEGTIRHVPLVELSEPRGHFGTDRDADALRSRRRASLLDRAEAPRLVSR
eukprot:6647071-Prymnesium_polylepis.2